MLRLNPNGALQQSPEWRSSTVGLTAVHLLHVSPREFQVDDLLLDLGDGRLVGVTGKTLLAEVNQRGPRERSGVSKIKNQKSRLQLAQPRS